LNIELIWTEPTLSDLDEIADYIALDDPLAAAALVRRVFEHVEQLAGHPESGSVPRELRPGHVYRQIVEPSWRVFYRFADDQKVYIVHVMRGEQPFHRKKLTR
jgi:plasmid stabilization system protein ParE